MPRKVAVRNWSFAQRRRISKVRESFEEIDLGQSIYDSLVGTDFIDPTVARIRAQYGNVGLSMVVGNTTTLLHNVGLTTFFNVGGTNVFGSDGVNTFIIVGGQTYVFNLTATGSTIGVN